MLSVNHQWHMIDSKELEIACEQRQYANATYKVKSLEQMTDRWSAHVGLASYADTLFDSLRNPPPVTSPSWVL